MRQKASMLRMDYARSAQGIHTILSKDGDRVPDDLDRDEDLRYKKQRGRDRLQADESAALGMVQEEDTEDEAQD